MGMVRVHFDALSGRGTGDRGHCERRFDSLAVRENVVDQALRCDLEMVALRLQSNLLEESRHSHLGRAR